MADALAGAQLSQQCQPRVDTLLFLSSSSHQRHRELRFRAKQSRQSAGLQCTEPGSSVRSNGVRARPEQISGQADQVTRKHEIENLPGTICKCKGPNRPTVIQRINKLVGL